MFPIYVLLKVLKILSSDIGFIDAGTHDTCI